MRFEKYGCSFNCVCPKINILIIFIYKRKTNQKEGGGVDE